MTGEAAVPRLSFEHPAFSVLETSVRQRLLSLDHFPAPDELRTLAGGIPSSIPAWFDFAVQDQDELVAAGGFDAMLARTSNVPTRTGSFHDLLGACIWLHFPALKTAIHRGQLTASERARGPRENALTHLDESGVLVVGTDVSVFESLSALAWPEVFWDRREELLRSTRFLVFGHGLLDALREPHPRLMGKALFVQVSADCLERGGSELRVLLDAALAPHLSEFLAEPACLEPLPVLGVPGWSAHQTRAYYEDERYFRRARSRPRVSSGARWLVLE